jgi:hypothetical protein
MILFARIILLDADICAFFMAIWVDTNILGLLMIYAGSSHDLIIKLNKVDLINNSAIYKLRL